MGAEGSKGKGAFKSFQDKKEAEDDVARFKAPPAPAPPQHDPVVSVMQKVLQNPIYKEKLENDPATLRRFSEVLANKEELKRTYLTTDWVETVKLYSKLRDDLREDAATASTSRSKQGKFTSTSESSGGDIINLEREEDDEVDQNELQQAEMDAELMLKNKVKIKIIIAEVAHSSARKSFRKLVSPILSKFDLLPEFGMFHSALMIGPWLIEWNNSALCIPRKCVSKAALLSADIESLKTSSEIQDVVDKLAEVIVEWNTQKGYKDRGGDKSKDGNCQDFVEEVLRRLDIRPHFTGPLGDFLRKLRDRGICEMEFCIDDDFREAFQLREKRVVFSTHAELDRFVNHLQQREPEFDTKYRHEWAMLKSFDRAFWLRHYKFPQDERWAPLRTEEVDEDGDSCLELACPYRDPEETFSIRFLR